MGQQGSKSTIEARVIFQREDMYHRMDVCSSASSVHIQKKVTRQSSGFRSSPRALEKATHHSSWTQSHGDAEGLVYVMDNPTGGVWVKPGEKWSRS